RRLPPPTASPLFPYTTLFRSHARRAHPAGRYAAEPVPRSREPVRGRVHRLTRDEPRRGGRGRRSRRVRLVSDPARFAAPARALRDRKSTRLNSSHLGISYAVF